MGCKEVQALWEYVYGPSGIGPGAPWGTGKPKIQFFLSPGVSGAPSCPFLIFGIDPFLSPMPPMDPILLSEEPFVVLFVQPQPAPLMAPEASMLQVPSEVRVEVGHTKPQTGPRKGE